MEEKINELRRIIQDKEYTIQELEKIKPIYQRDGTVVKFREVDNFKKLNSKKKKLVKIKNFILIFFNQKINFNL